MSLILEALKKSERQRRLGEAPTLGSPVMSVRRRRSRLPLLLCLIAVVVAAGWWWQRQAPDAVPADTSTAASEPPVASEPPMQVVSASDYATEQSERRQSKRASATDDATSAGTADVRLPRSRVAPDATSGVAPDLREKLRSGELVVPNPDLLKRGDPATSKAGDAVVGVVPDAPDDAPPVAAEPVPGQMAPPAAPAEVRAAVAPGAREPGAGLPPLIWELAYAQRREIPELKVTMHVFASDPAQRFVIINGTRHGEGDDIENLKLEAISAEGIVFSIQGQRFLYPRGGR